MKMTATQSADRLALIKTIADRRNKMAKVKAKTRKVYNFTSTQTSKPKALDVPKDNININQYTDASKYAQEYYGETLYYTTKYDNDWD